MVDDLCGFVPAFIDFVFCERRSKLLQICNRLCIRHLYEYIITYNVLFFLLYLDKRMGKETVYGYTFVPRQNIIILHAYFMIYT